MFSFFGLFADPVEGLQEQISEAWPDLTAIVIESPFPAVAIRFGQDIYKPSDEDIPEAVNVSVQKLSARNPAARFLLLRTECWGDTCADWGHVFEDGRIVCQTDGSEALRRLAYHFGVELGPQEIFAPLRRDFPWPT
jgi:hypothetical protein